MSSKQDDQRIVDLGWDIIKDSKRRTLYYDEKTKKGYQVKEADLKWVRFYKLRLFLSLFVYFMLFLFFRNQTVDFRFLVSLISAIVFYIGLTFGFEKLFFRDKVPFKISQKDFEQRYEVEVLKHKRTLQLFHLGFVVIYGILAVMDLYFANSPVWMLIVAGGIAVVLSIILLNRVLALNSQIKISKQKEDN